MEEQKIKNYLLRRNTKPLMTIRYCDHPVSGRIYVIGDPEVTLYKFSISLRTPIGRFYSAPVGREDYTDREIVDKYKRKGWEWTFVCPYNGYEIDCLQKTEPFKELPKGDNLVGTTWSHLLIGRNEIEDYMRINFRGFESITIYRVPENLLK